MRIILFFSLHFVICHASFSQEATKMRIDPDKAYGGSVSDYFNKIEYIPLETTKESLFGDVARILITDSTFIIHDIDTKSILFFTKKGTYLKKITGRADEQFKISMDQIHNLLLVTYRSTSLKNEYFKYFTISGNPLLASENRKIKNSNATVSGEIALGNEYFAQLKNCTLSKNFNIDTITNFYLMDIVHKEKVVKQFLPYNQKNNLPFFVLAGYITRPKIIQNGSFYIATPFENNVYQINKDTAIKKFQFQFPEKRMIPIEIRKSTNIDSLLNAPYKVPDFDTRILDVSNIFFNNHILFFKINVRGYVSTVGQDHRFQYNFMYDTISKKLSSLERITPDSRSYFLPIRSFRTNINGLDYHQGEFYSTVSSLQMFTARNANKHRNPQYPPALQQYFKTQNRKSNPVIVRMKLKEGK